MLQLAWENQWDALIERCYTDSKEAFCVTQHSRRTPLHLATFNNACPVSVAQALLTANRHMVVVQDDDWYTPLHNICFFRGGDKLLPLFCDTALMVEQELQGRGILPTPSGTSPLFLAAKRAAPLESLQILLSTRKQQQQQQQQHKPNTCPITNWIAPSTGGEPYWNFTTLDEYSSPLEILLRNRGSLVFGRHLLVPNDASNEVRQGSVQLRQFLRTITLARFARLRHNTSSRHSFETMESSRILPESWPWPSKPHNNDEDDNNNNNNNNSDNGSNQGGMNQEQQEVVDLWQKCLELLVEHCPRLVTNDSNEDLDQSECCHSTLSFGLVHAVACIKVPIPLLLQVALCIFPEQATQRDSEFGMIPLHHVITAKHPYAAKTLIGILLQHNPMCATIPFPNGQLPLHRALEQQQQQQQQQFGGGSDHSMSISKLTATAAGAVVTSNTSSGCDNYDWIIPDLIQADQHSSLTIPDPITGLYPFCLAASSNRPLTMIYSLLSANPQVIVEAITKRSR